MLRIWESIGQDGMHVRRVDVAQEGVAEDEVESGEVRWVERELLVRVDARRCVRNCAIDGYRDCEGECQVKRMDWKLLAAT